MNATCSEAGRGEVRGHGRWATAVVGRTSSGSLVMIPRCMETPAEQEESQWSYGENQPGYKHPAECKNLQGNETKNWLKRDIVAKGEIVVESVTEDGSTLPCSCSELCGEVGMVRTEQ